jgi:hypothetical protein
VKYVVLFLINALFAFFSQMADTETEQTTDNVASLIRFVKSLKEVTLDKLLTELEERPKAFSVYLKRTEEHWEKYYKLPGNDIYNELHPQTAKQGILYNKY